MILVLVAGLCLAMMAFAQTIPPETGKNSSMVPENLTGGDPEPEGGAYVQGELLVRFDPAAFPTINAMTVSSMQAHATIGAVLKEEYPDIPGLELVQLPGGMRVEDGIAYYTAIPTVMYAEQNAIYTITNTSGNTTTMGPAPAGDTSGTGDLFVKYNATSFETPEELNVYANTTNAAVNASVVTDYSAFGMPGLQLVALEENMTTLQGMSYYQNVTYVDYAEPNVQYHTISSNTTASTITREVNES